MVKTAIKIRYSYIIIFIVFLIFALALKNNFITYNPTQYKIPFFIKHTDKYTPRVVSDVPLVIYESWHSNTVPEKMKENIYKLIEMNPQFDYYLYSDEACLEFIKENFNKDVVDAFNTLKPGAYKSDLWRYCILYKKGGVYLDIKYYSLVSLLSIIEENPIIYVKDLPYTIKDTPYIITNGIYNAFMVSPPNNIVFKKCIDDIVHSCKNKLYKRNTLDITGPSLLGEIVSKEYSDDYIDKLKFTHKKSLGHPMVLYNNKVILKAYYEYRKDQKYFQKTKHYSEMYRNKDVYETL